MRPGTPWDSIRLAVLTVSPQTSYWNLVVPMMPATAGPLFTPRRNWSLPTPNPVSVTWSRMPSAKRASACAWSGLETGIPHATM